MCVPWDEAQQVTNVSDMRRTIYSLNAGTTKAAGQGYHGEREVLTLRSPILSTGEFSFEQMIESDPRNKSNGESYAGGAALRINDLPFEGLSVPQLFQTAGEFADYLNATAKTHYGFHFREWIEMLVADREQIIEHLKAIAADALPEESVAQLRRVRNRYAWMAAVIELAIERGILPWKPGTGIRALAAVFEAWKASRGGTDSYEENKALVNFESTKSDRYKVRVCQRVDIGLFRRPIGDLIS